MTKSRSPFGTFFLPGPTEVREEVLAAMSRPMMSHRGPEFAALFQRVQEGLKVVFDTTRPVFISTSSSTGLMEAGVRSAPAGRVLSLVNGAFSERFAHIAENCGREVDRYIVEWGEVHDPAEVEKRLVGGRYAVVTVVHSETSSGALNDVKTITDVAHQFGSTCLVDSVSGVGGAELRFDAWGMDYVLTGSQKAIAIPPGLAFAVASEEFMRRLRHDGAAAADRRGVYFDLAEHEEHVRNGQAPNTPAISLYYALDVQLESIAAETMPARWARHRAMAARAAQWVDDMKKSSSVSAIRILARDRHRSPTVSTIMLPGGISSSTVTRVVAEQGITVGTGYGKLKESAIRIGHMGDHTLETLERCLEACAVALGAAGSA
jgi:aspartate aminotransferase-like enzyme